jgi:Chaperone for flagella basal body P-ring formation
VIAPSVFVRSTLVFGIALASLLGTELTRQIAAKETRSPPGTSPTLETRQQIWQAVVAELRGRGLAEQRLPRLEDLDLPGALPVLSGRKLRATSACWDERPRRTQIRLECSEPGQCLPFLVYYRNDLRNDLRDEPRDAGTPHSDTAVRVGLCRATASPIRPISESHQAVRVSAQEATVRAGEPATAVFLTGHFRMTASVTCLDRGHEGEVIRVRSQNGQVLRARISGPALLEVLQ